MTAAIEPNPLHTVLVPGLGCTASLYEAVLADVWAHGAVTIADTRRDASIGDMAERLLADAPERFAVAGFSMGGFVALEVVRRAPARVLGLALISTSGEPDTPEKVAERRELLALLRDGELREVTDSIFPKLVGSSMAEFWAQMAHQVGTEQFCAQIEAVLGRSDYRPTLAGITCPTAIIHGALDRMVPVGRGQALAAAIPHATTTILEAGRHFAIREQPELAGAALSALLHAARGVSKEPSRG